MTRERGRSRWQSMTNAAARRWDRLTTDDLAAVRGNAERFIELLQSRYGLAREDALAELDAWRRSLAALSRPASRPN